MFLVHNLGFDRPRVAKALGITIPRVSCLDTMDLHHYLFNAFKRNLGFATSLGTSARRLKMWKHLAQSEPELYSCVDAIALIYNYRDYRTLLQAQGSEEGWRYLHTDLDPALDYMSSTGMLVDRAKRAELSVELGVELVSLLAQMNAIVPPAVKSPKVWTTRKNAEKGKATLVAKLKANGDPWERIEDADIFPIPGTKHVTKCVTCGTLDVHAPHWTRKFLKETTSGPDSQGDLFAAGVEEVPAVGEHSSERSVADQPQRNRRAARKTRAVSKVAGCDVEPMAQQSLLHSNLLVQRSLLTEPE